MTAVEEFEAQGVLKPGEAGYWKVWGATPRDIQAGDVVLVAGDEDFVEVQEVYKAAADPLQIGIVVDGERQVIGVLARVAIVRPGTKNTLGRFVR